MKTDYTNWIPKVQAVAKEAASSILDVFHQKTFQVRKKVDNSPITEADLLAHTIIDKGLKNIALEIPLVSEEGIEIPYETRKNWQYCWMIDPLDGTREFIRGSDEFTVNIALIENHVPVLGVVYVPVLNQCYSAQKGQPSYFKQDDEAPKIIKSKSHITFPIKVAISRHHDKEKNTWIKYLEEMGEFEFVYCGSALKICLVAKGEVDLYPRMGPTGEWDTAAGHCILEAAGGKLVDFSGKALQYNARPTLVNPGFFAVSCVELLSYIVDKSSQFFDN